ncbi:MULTISPECIES: hypothetical protein [unclassified Saccharicrinis]|uniref:hypothetical protein n=1 Tax=unclassified Saccharicrinis TaxID=2646859 RepID=UPI0035DCA5E2
MANNMYKKNQPTAVSPDINNLKEVIIDFKTRIYIDKDADAEEAKERYLSRLERRKK